MLQQDLADRVLAGCTRLESLAHASYYTPAAWLGLAHLHTLRGVDLGVVSTAAIAAALPRLHTLEAFFRCPAFFASPEEEEAFDTFAFATDDGFTANLLPRLHVFQFSGSWWPQMSHRDDDSVVAPLPLLRDLSWQSDQPPPWSFMSARPVRLRMQHSVVVDWLSSVDDDDAAASSQVSSSASPLTQVRELFTIGCDTLDASDAARLFRAAPQLRKFTAGGLTNCPQWVTLTAGRGDSVVGAATMGHPYLRHLAVTLKSRGTHTAAAPDCATLLRARHFPRLLQVVIDAAQYHSAPVE
jgi:hypothetical protein